MNLRESFRTATRRATTALGFRTHPARIGQTALLYTFAFDLGRDRSFTDVAASLLSAGIAEFAVDADDDEIQLAPRYFELLGSKAAASRLIDVGAYIDGRMSFRDLSFRSRTLLIRVLLRAIPYWFANWRAGSVDDPDQGGNPNYRKSLADHISSIFPYIDSAVRNAQLPTVAHNAVDRSLYSAAYLIERPFVRLALHPVPLHGVQSSLGAHSGQESDATVSLLLHRSGIALLTITMETSREVTATELSSLTLVRNATFQKFDLPEAVVTSYAKQHRITQRRLGNLPLDTVYNGQRWHEFELAGYAPSSPVELFQLLRGAILNHAGQPRTTDWICCPTLLVDHLLCCGSRNRWMHQHEDELAAILANAPPSDDLVLDMPTDFSTSRITSFYVPGHLALEIYWAFNQPSGSTLVD